MLKTFLVRIIFHFFCPKEKTTIKTIPKMKKFWRFGHLIISLCIPGCRPEESLLALLVECWSKSRFLQLCFLDTASYWNVCKKREKENQRDRPWRLGSVNFTTRVQNLTVTKPIRLELKSLEKLVNLIRLVRLTVCWQADLNKMSGSVKKKPYSQHERILHIGPESPKTYKLGHIAKVFLKLIFY